MSTTVGRKTSLDISKDGLPLKVGSSFDGSTLKSTSRGGGERDRITPKGRPRRSVRNKEEDDFHQKWEGLEKKEEKSRAELLGVTQPRLPKAQLKQLAKGDPRFHDPDSDDPLQRASLQELEGMALDKSKAVTSDLRNVLKITKEAEDIGAATLENLQKQGEQIARTQDKTAELDQELSKVIGNYFPFHYASLMSSFSYVFRDFVPKIILLCPLTYLSSIFSPFQEPKPFPLILFSRVRNF